MSFSLAIAILAASCVTCVLLIIVLRPLLQRYALARPNARSSHVIPTPQGGGVAVIVTTIAVAVISGAIIALTFDVAFFALLISTVCLAAVGAFDDLRPMPVLPRFTLQALTVALILATLPEQFHLVKSIPLWGERAILLLGGLWFVNLVNFMDGLDWMTVAEIVPISIALGVFGLFGVLPPAPTLLAVALCGAVIGFAFFNRPVAKLFLGDVGSLPIGLLVGWCLLHLAGSGHLVAAALLPLYYLADATITLLRRLLNGERVWIAHRTHFYQRATDNGFSVLQVVTEVFVLNVVLAVLATLILFTTSPYAPPLALAAGIGCVALMLMRFSRRRS
ncbi:MraY family glycosyltransferase [Bradyrhizobium sp. SYSU BS000235]|uniref:MraY family glycosyltransferase n=1 Tax=Bradyrhizobium sp. SYSU BS000235 TaxID=3411332 RepID=UPI003C745222